MQWVTIDCELNHTNSGFKAEAVALDHCITTPVRPRSLQVSEGSATRWQAGVPFQRAK